MDLWRRAQADLDRPDIASERDLFMVVVAPLIVVIAQLSRPGSPFELLALVPTVAVFVAQGLGGRVPWWLFAALTVVPVTLVVGYDGNLEGTLFLPVMSTLYTAGHIGSVIRAGTILAASAASPVVVAALTSDSGIWWIPWTFANVFTFSLGRLVGRQRTLIEQLEAAREALAEQAVAEERRRIARELHDLAGHTLAAMMLHVTGARHVLERDPAEAGRALLDAEQVGRVSLDQIRATVRSLRADERGTDPAPASVADLSHLVDTYRRAGLAIELRVDGDVAELDGPVGTALHRMAQEALANVARHAPGNDVTLSVTVHEAAGDGARLVRLIVADSGRQPAPPRPDGLGFGLVGMAERARALGGQLDAGPHEQGWRVHAEVPLSPPVGEPAVEASL